MDDFSLKTDLVQVKGKAKGGKVKVVKYDRSFLSRIIQNEKAKRFYDEVKNYCLSFEKVKARSAWGAENFLFGSDILVKMIFFGGELCVCLDLDPDAYSQKDYPHGVTPNKKDYDATPMLLPLRTAAEMKIVRRLIGETFTSRCIYTVDFPARADYVASLPAQKDEALIKKNLIKKTETEMSEADAKKALAAAIHAEAEEEKILEEIAGKKPVRTPKKKPVQEDIPESPVEEIATPLPESPATQTDAEEASEQEDTVFELAEEEEVLFELAKDGLVIEVHYDRSFTARIIQSEKAKSYYGEIKNYALSFGLKSRISWKADTFHFGRKTYLIAKIRGKTLCLYLALDPKAYDENIYHQKDVSDKKSYEDTPMMIRVRSDLGLRKAKRLLSEMLSAAELSEKEIPQVDYAAQYPFEETDALIEKKLIKRIERKLDKEESDRLLQSGNVVTGEEKKESSEDAQENADPQEEVEEIAFELAEEEAPAEEAEDVEFELASEEDAEEEVEFELAEDGKEGDDDVEDVSFELAEDLGDSEGGMESYGAEDEQGRYVTLRKYIRGFAAKMKQGDQDRKDYYAEIKSRLLSYKGVKVSDSFSGDTFKKGSRILLKSRIRGKTLCLFFALDTDSYKQTIYRQQYKGDVKAYAATPMMVRVKSEQGLKRALRLIEDLGRNYEMQAGEAIDLLEVRKSFLYEETPALVEKGEIKTRLVTVTKYEAEELLKKNAK